MHLLTHRDSRSSGCYMESSVGFQQPGNTASERIDADVREQNGRNRGRVDPRTPVSLLYAAGGKTNERYDTGAIYPVAGNDVTQGVDLFGDVASACR